MATAEGPRRFSSDADEIADLEREYSEKIFNIEHLQHLQDAQIANRGTVRKVKRRHEEEALMMDLYILEMDERRELRR